MKPHNTSSYFGLSWSGDTILNQQSIPENQLSLESICDLNFGCGQLLDGFWIQGVEVIWCTQGRVQMTLDQSKTISLKQNDFAVIYSDQMLGIQGVEKRNSLTRIIITGEEAEDWMNSFGFYNGFVGSDPIIRANLTIIDQSKQKTVVIPIENRGPGNAITLRLLRNHLTAVHERIRRQGKQIFFDAVKLFNANLEHGAVRVKQVAELLEISTNTLHLAFKDSEFKSPGEFIACRQLHLAKRLLLNTRIPIKEIAKRCGFLTAAHFTTFIKRKTGKLPSSFR